MGGHLRKNFPGPEVDQGDKLKTLKTPPQDSSG